jgi:hypothetical protein
MPEYNILIEVEKLPSVDITTQEFQDSPWAAILRSIYAGQELAPGIRVVRADLRPEGDTNRNIAAWLREKAQELDPESYLT